MAPCKLIYSLSSVRDRLEKSTCQHASLFLSLMDSGKNHSLKCSPSLRIVFGPEQSDFPSLGKMLSPFYRINLPSLEKLQELLSNDLQAVRLGFSQNSSVSSLSPGIATDLSDDEITLFDSLADADKEIECGPLCFPSQSLESLCRDSKAPVDDEIYACTTKAFVFGRDMLINLECSNEGTTFTTLLSGELAWYIWPPTEHNLSLLQKWYEDVAGGAFDIQDPSVAMELEGGVTLVQSAGEALRIPPNCPLLCLPLKTSLLATYYSVTSTQLVKMLSKLPLWFARFTTEIDEERGKRKLAVAITENLTDLLEEILESTDLKNYAYPGPGIGPLHYLMRSWDGVKNNVASLLDPTQEEQVVALWGKLLRNIRGRDCCICGNPIRDKFNNARKHFESEHWVSREDDIIADEHNEETRISGASASEPGDASVDDAMQGLESEG